jgi:hypothetical protein
MSRSGTGEVIRGHAPGTRDRGRGHGEGRAIAAAGGEEVEPGRGLDKLEDKYTRTSVVPVAHGPTGWDSNAPQTSTATVDPGTRAIIGVASAVGGAATLAAAAWGYSRR